MANNANYTEEVLQSITYTHDYWIFLAPLLMHMADVITGWVQATINKTWDSTKMRNGIMLKALLLFIVILAYFFEYAIEAVRQAHVATFVSIVIVWMELVSVFENLHKAGVPLPRFIEIHLKKAKEELKDVEKDDLEQTEE